METADARFARALIFNSHIPLSTRPGTDRRRLQEHRPGSSLAVSWVRRSFGERHGRAKR